MQALEEVNSLVLDVNRDVQAMVFFVRSPPRIDTDQKFLDLAKVATADFRTLSAKVAELNDLFPEADTYIMSLDLVMEAIQSYLVSTIRKIRSCLTAWMDAQQSLSPGPTLEFLPPLIAEMSSLVESVVSNTKAIQRHLTGERIEPPKRPSSIILSDRLEIHPVDDLVVSILVEDPSAENIASYLGVTVPSTTSSDAKPPPEPELPSKPIASPSFEDLLRDYERQERKEERSKQKRANAPLKQVTKREAIEIDPEFLDAIVLHLSELTAVFFNESNYFGKKPIDINSSTVAMPQIEANASLANEKALSLQTASIDMESFLNDNDQTHLAKLTGLHMNDIVSSMKDVIGQAPNVSWDALRLLDVAIKDYAETIKDVVQLSSPEVAEVPDEDEILESDSESEDDIPPPPKVQRLLTREEELLQDFDAVSDAFDALEMAPTTRRRTSSAIPISVSPVLARSAPEAGILTASPPRTPSSWVSGSSALAGSPLSSRPESRVTIQFPSSYYNTPATEIKTSVTPPPMASDEVKERERTRPVLTAAKSASFIEPTYELADEAVRSCEPLRLPDRWSEMQQRSELQRTISPDGVISTGSDRESSKLKSAFKFMTSIRKKASASRLSTSGPAASPSSSSRDSKRRTVGYSIGSGVSSPNSSPLAPRKSMQLTGVLPTDPRLWLFEQPDDDDTLRISPETDSIVAGTIEKLVQRLTHDLLPDPDYVLQFLTTHKCFIPSADLLELLCLRWDSAPPPDMDPAVFESSRLPSIRLRVYNVLKTWIERFWSDFAGEPELIERLQIFAAAMYHSGLSSASQTLTKLIFRNRFEEVPKPQLGEPPLVYDFVRRSRHEPPIVPPNNTLSASSDAIGANGSHLSPPSTPTSRSGSPMPMNGSLATAQAVSKSYVPAILVSALDSLPRPLTILDFHPFEIARQVSSMEWELWKQVKNVELLDVAWTRKDKETRAPNVLNMIRFSNHITNWLISEVLAPEDPKERSVVLNRCIWVVKALVELRNFNGAMEALSAFHSSAIFRLKSTWNHLPPPTWSIYENLEKLMSPDANFKTYRAEYDRSVPPCTPYLGTHLSDLLFLEESLPRHIEGNKLINFAKMEKTAQFIQTLELSQQIPYHFVEIPLIRSYIKNYTPLDPKDAYNRSLAVEARKQKPGRGPPASYRNTTIGNSESPPISSSPSA